MPRPHSATSCSKLRRLPNIGSTAGSPSAERKRGFSCQAVSILLEGCCAPRLLGDAESEFSILATSERGNPVIIATRDLLSRPLSLQTRLAAVRTALSLNSWLKSRTVTPASNIRSISGSTRRFIATIVASLSGSSKRDLWGACFLGISFRRYHLCKSLHTEIDAHLYCAAQGMRSVEARIVILTVEYRPELSNGQTRCVQKRDGRLEGHYNWLPAQRITFLVIFGNEQI